MHICITIQAYTENVFLTDNDNTKTMQIKSDVSDNKVPSSVEDKIYGCTYIDIIWVYI